MDWVKPGRAVRGNCLARLTVIELMIGYYNLDFKVLGLSPIGTCSSAEVN